MAEFLVRLPEGTQAFIEEQVASQQFASAGDYIVSLVEEAQRRATIDRVDRLLLDGIASGPGEEATPEWWAQTKAQWRQNRGATRS
jgi:antitoxin ParD1/3/4